MVLSKSRHCERSEAIWQQGVGWAELWKPNLLVLTLGADVCRYVG